MIRIYDGESNCTVCGRKHKHIYEIDGIKYGIQCAKKVLGVEIKSPVWLYELANKYIDKNINEYDISFTGVDDFQTNFWNENNTNYDYSKPKKGVYMSAVKVNGKNVSVDMQFEIVDYLKKAFYNTHGYIYNSDGSIY